MRCKTTTKKEIKRIDYRTCLLHKPKLALLEMNTSGDAATTESLRDNSYTRGKSESRDFSF